LLRESRVVTENLEVRNCTVNVPQKRSAGAHELVVRLALACLARRAGNVGLKDFGKERGRRRRRGREWRKEGKRGGRKERKERREEREEGGKRGGRKERREEREEGEEFIQKFDLKRLSLQGCLLR
jgi:hypothetical protein